MGMGTERGASSPDHEEAEQARLRQKLYAEFEEFVSMAAHNLREPLRDVASFSQMMAETYAERLDSEAGVWLARIRDGAARMQLLLADMVDHWVAGTGDRPLCQTDMEAAVRQALLCANKQIVDRCAVVTHDPLPTVYGDFDAMARVLHHLIRNGIEYSGTASPKVHISCKRVDQEWVFAVQDNGPGIEPAYQGRIFEVFKRLHGREHPGNGLGLAFCKRAIEAQGGRMWVESAPGAGATFFFSAASAGE